jgi:hypothetical protein
MSTGDEYHFEYALGFAVVRLWADLRRETQERLFNEATAGDNSLRERLATFLHGKHPHQRNQSNSRAPEAGPDRKPEGAAIHAVSRRSPLVRGKSESDAIRCCEATETTSSASSQLAKRPYNLMIAVRFA